MKNGIVRFKENIIKTGIDFTDLRNGNRTNFSIKKIEALIALCGLPDNSPDKKDKLFNSLTELKKEEKVNKIILNKNFEKDNEQKSLFIV